MYHRWHKPQKKDKYKDKEEANKKIKNIRRLNLCHSQEVTMIIFESFFFAIITILETEKKKIESYMALDFKHLKSWIECLWPPIISCSSCIL